MTRTLVRMVAFHLGQGPQTDHLTRQVPVRFPVVSGHTPIAFQNARNEYEIEPSKGRGAHARIRTGDLFLTKWSLVPGEFDLILGRPADLGADHLVAISEILARVPGRLHRPAYPGRGSSPACETELELGEPVERRLRPLRVAHNCHRGARVGDGRRSAGVVDHVQDATEPGSREKDGEQIVEAGRRE